MVPQLQIHKQELKTLLSENFRYQLRPSGTDPQRDSTHSSERPADKCRSISPSSSPCRSGWGPRSTPCKTGSPIYLWTVPVFKRIHLKCRRNTSFVHSIHQHPFCTPSPMSSWYLKQKGRKDTRLFGRDHVTSRFLSLSDVEMFPGGGGTSVARTTVK